MEVLENGAFLEDVCARVGLVGLVSAREVLYKEVYKQGALWAEVYQCKALLAHKL